jgi:glucokinase
MARLYGGIDLGGTSMKVVVATPKGEVKGSAGCPTIPGATPAETIEAIAQQLEAAAAAASVRTSKLKGIGIGAPGAVDPKRGIVVMAPNLGWKNIRLGAALEKRLGSRVAVGNDVQVAIMGEHAFGAARGCNRVVGVWVGTGIGGGLIIDGRLDRGARGAAGEIGHVLLKENGPLCGCGRHGCAEALASRTAMERDVREAARTTKTSVLQIMKERDKTRMTSSVMARALKANDPVMKRVLANAQHYLGLLVGNLVNVLDPEMVVLGGGVSQRLGEPFVAPIREVARSRFLRPDPDGKVRIEPSILGDFSGALGACALARHELA